MAGDMQHCTRCGERLVPNRVVWLELSTVTGKYSETPLPPAESQGWFPFGMSCAKKANKGKAVR